MNHRLTKPYLCAYEPGHEDCLEINVKAYINELFAPLDAWKNSPERSWNL